MADISVTFVSDPIISIGGVDNTPLFSGTFVSDSILQNSNIKISVQSGTQPNPQTYISDGLLSFGAFNPTPLSSGIFRSDDIMQFYNKNIIVRPESTIQSATFISDSILQFNSQSLVRMPLVVTQGGAPQTPKYFVG